REARQYVDGVAVDASAFAHDTRHPVRSSDVRQLLAESGITAVTTIVAGAPLPDAGVVVVDAQDEADLRALVRSAGDRADVLWVGSPGLARALAEERAPGPRSAGVVARRLLIVAGTHHVATRRQVETLLRTLGDRAVVFGDDDPEPSPRVEVAVLLAPPRPSPEPVDDDSAHAVADRLARRAAELIRQTGIDGCIATGGETADAVVRALDREAIEVLGEPEPGVGLGIVHGRARCLLATKAGGFGDPGTLLRLHDAMTLSGRPRGG
ncbi:MAG: nucleotide-binding domain containing protein, partial [Pseudonocardiaceae bacterium]